MRLLRLLQTLAIGSLLAHASPAALAQGENGSERAIGALYTMSNAATGNRILAFEQAQDGTLTPAGSFSTGGLGTDGGLGNQGALALSDDGRHILVVNAGSDEISSLAIRHGSLELVGQAPSGGVRPVSVAISGELIYVLNAGSDSVSGFRFERGRLTPIPDSSRALSGAGTDPAQVSFSGNGRTLIVTEKATNTVTTFTVQPGGLLDNPVANPSAAPTPFGFAVGRRGQIFVSEAVGGAANASVLSSYRLERDGTLSAISPAVATNQTAACWVVLSANGKFAYTTNTGSDTISGYRVARDGSPTLLNADGITASTGAGTAPIDMALSDNGDFLYTLNSGNGTIGAFRLGRHGDLTPIPGASGLPVTANGLIAR